MIDSKRKAPTRPRRRSSRESAPAAGGDRPAEESFVPAFCGITLVFPVVFGGQLLAFILVFAGGWERGDLWQHISLVSLYVQWIGLNSAGLLCLILWLFWRRSQRAEASGTHGFLTKPGSVFGLMFVLYGLLRFLIELLRDDNPFEVDHLTISQLISMGVIVLGIAMLIFFTYAKPEKLTIRKP